MTFPTQDTINQRLEAARAIFLANDSHLLEADVSERAMTHKFAEALQQVFRSWHVDCEYNRIGHDEQLIKRLPEWASKFARETDRVFPDIIVRRRSKTFAERKEKNCLVIEAKPSTAVEKEIKLDIEKLRAYKNELGYQHALHLTFHVAGKVDITWQFM
jgi:hypothetical protein